MVVETDLGPWHVYETPGHAPSHVVLHQPERGLLISGDHLLGRVSLYYDYGWTPDPAGEFLSSLDVVEKLDARLCLAGHGRPFRDVRGAHRRQPQRRWRSGWSECARRSRMSGARRSRSSRRLLGEQELTPMMVNWGLSETLCYLRHLERLGEVEKVEEDPERWLAA